jgi:hypothetical protein
MPLSYFLDVLACESFFKSVFKVNSIIFILREK